MSASMCRRYVQGYAFPSASGGLGNPPKRASTCEPTACPLDTAIVRGISNGVPLRDPRQTPVHQAPQ